MQTVMTAKNSCINIEKLKTWIDSVKECAKADTEAVIHWFDQTIDQPFSIVAGWQKMFTNNDFSDLFCTSKSQPEYVMCIKIVSNKGPYAYTDFEVMDMPLDQSGEADDTCIPLEWNDPPEVAAQFFLMEWERIMVEHGEEV